MSRSLNRASLIGNLTRDPELRYTPQGPAVCSFSVATNRQWKTESGEARDEVDFHRIVAWSKLGELCAQLLKKGARVFVEGRISNRKWTGKDGVDRNTTEIVITDMMLLTSRSAGAAQDAGGSIDVPEDFGESNETEKKTDTQASKPAKVSKPKEDKKEDDIPF